MNTPEYEREEQYDDIYYPNAVQSSARPFDIFNTSNRQGNNRIFNKFANFSYENKSIYGQVNRLGHVL
jgi:hypothetical protein